MRFGQREWRAATEGRELAPGETIRCPHGCELSWGTEMRAVLERDAVVAVEAARFVRFTSSMALRCPVIALVAGAVTVEVAGEVPLIAQTSANDTAAIVGGRADIRRSGDGVAIAPAGASVSLRRGARWEALEGAALYHLAASGVTGRERIAPPVWQVGSLSHRPLALATALPRADVSLAWTRVAHASAYHVEIARDEAFNDVVKRHVVDASADQLTLSVEEGAYHARSYSADGDGFWSTPSAALQIRVMRVALPTGGDVLGDGSIVLPKATTLRMLDHRGIDVALHDGGFFRASREITVGPAAAQRLRFRLTGDPASESTFIVRRRALRAEISFAPNNPTWPNDALKVRVKLNDPTGRVDTTTVKPRFTLRIGGRVVPAHFRFDGSHWVADVVGREIGSPQLLRLDVGDGAGDSLGRAYLEVVAAPREPVAKPAARRLERAPIGAASSDVEVRGGRAITR
jgi:hypothetical protein